MCVCECIWGMRHSGHTVHTVGQRANDAVSCCCCRCCTNLIMAGIKNATVKPAGCSPAPAQSAPSHSHNPAPTIPPPQPCLTETACLRDVPAVCVCVCRVWQLHNGHQPCPLPLAMLPTHCYHKPRSNPRYPLLLPPCLPAYGETFG